MEGGPGGSLWLQAVEECLSRGCDGRADEFLSRACSDPGLCVRPPRRGRSRRYEWVERLIEVGVPDGRSRLILYVVSRYLVNIKGLSPEEAEPIVESFIEASCRNHGNCGKIYRSWVRNVLRHVARGGWKPWSPERIQREDPQLYEILKSVLGDEAFTRG